jgi:16S rRNA (guanine527-N7)-methyltransferase
VTDEARARAIAQVCAELALGASEARVAAMADYLQLLERWNRTHNLTAVREPEAMLTQHLADCLAAVAALQRHPCGAAARRVLDVGSGGGLPGVLLALFRPQSQVVCIDAVGKKAAFIRQAAGQLRLANLDARHGRVEHLACEPFDLITARAFADLAELVRLTRRLLGSAGCWMAMKGQVPDAEIACLPPDVQVFHVEPLEVPGLEARRCLVWMQLSRDS